VIDEIQWIGKIDGALWALTKNHPFVRHLLTVNKPHIVTDLTSGKMKPHIVKKSTLPRDRGVPFCCNSGGGP
jgi:hypothetical protein